TLSFAGGDEVFAGQPVKYRYEDDIFSGEKRSDLLVVPALSVRVAPEVAILPAAATTTLSAASQPSEKPAARSGQRSTRAKPQPSEPAAGPARVRPARQPGAKTAAPPASPAEPPATGREIRVTVTNDTRAAVEAVVKLRVPDGWIADPADQM